MTEILVSREIIRDYAAASGDDNPIHVCDEAARALGLPGAIAHGMWTFGAALAASVGERRVVRTTCKFAAPVVLPPEGETKALRVDAVEHDETTVILTIYDGTDRVAKIEVRCE